MTDKQLEYIVAIAAEGNITRAAEKLYIGQSALSQVLSHVESEFNIKIFLRSSSPLVPTHAGELFLNSAREILQIKQNLLAQFSEKEQLHFGSIHVGMSQSRSWLFTPLILPDFIRRYPDVNIIFTEGSAAELNNLLLNGKIDIVFAVSPHTNSKFQYHTLFDEQILLVLPNNHPLCISNRLKDPVDLTLLKDTPFILLHEDHNLRQLADKILSDAQICPRVLLESHSMDVCFQMSACGLGASIIPDTLYYYHRDRELVRVFPVGKQYGRKMSIVHRKNMYLPFVSREFIRIAKENLAKAYPKEIKTV